MTFRAGELPGIIEKLPSDGPAFRPARPFRPDHQHLPIHVRRDGRMLSIVTFAGCYDGCRNRERNGFDGIEVNLGSTLPSGTYALSAFAQIGRAHGTRVQFPRTHGRIVKRDSLVCGYEQGHISMDVLRRSAVENKERSALVCERPHTAASARTKGRRRNRYFARKSLAVLCRTRQIDAPMRSEEHTSELQSHSDLVCRLLLEKKKK